MKKTSIKLGLIALAMTTLTISCKKDVVKTYPNQITIDNWEEFVDAPKEVLDRLEAQEEKIKVERDQEQAITLKAACPGGPNFGKVRAWNGSWSGISGVKVTQANWTAYTNVLGNYALCKSTTGPVCMSYNTSQLNGVSTLDLVHIQRHILNIVPFDNILPESDAARRYVAADVDHNGVIDANDITAIQQLILGITTSLPGNNVTFVPEGDLVLAFVTDPWGLSFLQNNCRNNASYHMKRYAVKMGDVSGNFSF